ncbi:MAG: hypothetical protein AAFV53_13180 [Myxococcota bacterium]
MKTLYRLDRPIIGSRQLEPSPVAERARKRQVVKPSTVVLPDHLRPARGAVRAFRRQAEPGPNAPQLIRLNRNPFGMRQAPFSRAKTSEFSLVRPERKMVGGIFRDALESGKRLPFPKPTDVHPRHQPRRRPSVNDWLLSKGDSIDE